MAADETKHQEMNRESFVSVSIYDIYNKIQYPLSKLFIDIRSKEEYIKSHINHSIHLPSSNVTNDEIKQLFKDKFFFSSIYCFANKKQIDDNEDIKFYNQIQSILINQLNENQHEFFVLNEDISQFINKYPFLCVDNDNIYWNASITIESKKKKGKTSKNKKPKKQRINMIDTYYQRLHNYQKYPNQIINNKLYLGMLSQASEIDILNNLKITHIINVTPTDYPDMSIINNRKYYQIKIADIKQTCIADHFENAFKFIDDALNIPDNNDNRVLIHCKEGVSRSATIVIAYLMKQNKMKLNQALKFVKYRREVVEPNDGFMDQLRDFEKNDYMVKDKQS